MEHTQNYQIRDSTLADIPALTTVYRYHVLHDTGTFETDPPSETEMQTRHLDVLNKQLPYLVLETQAPEHEVVGFAYANWFKSRPAYRYSAEDSIYLHPAHCGKGLGTWLLQTLCAYARAAGLRSLIAVIGDSNNHSSIAMHKNCGFTYAGRLNACGYKFERWLDVVLMEKALYPSTFANSQNSQDGQT